MATTVLCLAAKAALRVSRTLFWASQGSPWLCWSITAKTSGSTSRSFLAVKHRPKSPLPARLGEPNAADVKPPADEAGDAVLAVGRLLYGGDISFRGIHSVGNDSLSESGWRVCVEMGVITLHVRQSVLPR